MNKLICRGEYDKEKTCKAYTAEFNAEAVLLKLQLDDQEDDLATLNKAATYFAKN